MSNILSGPEVVWLRGVKIHYFWNLDTCFHYIVFIIFEFNASFQMIYFIEFNEKKAYGHYGNYISGNVHLCVKILHNLQNITKLPRKHSGRVLASSVGGPGLNPQSRTAPYQRRFKNGTSNALV